MTNHTMHEGKPAVATPTSRGTELSPERNKEGGEEEESKRRRQMLSLIRKYTVMYTALLIFKFQNGPAAAEGKINVSVSDRGTYWATLLSAQTELHTFFCDLVCKKSFQQRGRDNTSSA